MRASLHWFLVAGVALEAVGAVAACGGDSDDGKTGAGTAGMAGRSGSSSGGAAGDAGETSTGGTTAGSDTGGTGGDPVSGGASGEDGEAGEGGEGASTAGTAGTGGRRAFSWVLPKGFPTPLVPTDNRMTNEKIDLGRHLFYDERLSGNGTQACASCHRQELAFTDGGVTSTGSTGQAHPRNSMTLANIAYAYPLTWANPNLFELESQALVPMFGTAPVELGLAGREAELLERLKDVPQYQDLFPAAYPNDDDPFTVTNVVRALSAFQRTLISGNSPFDRYTYGGQEDAISESAKRGIVMFGTEKFECFHCHAGFNFQDSVRFVGKPIAELLFHNNALYNIDGAGAYPAPNRGIFETTMTPSDMGRFRVPTLRNIAVTGPYMHDGSIQTLSEVLDHYAAGGRTVPSGQPNAGVGSANPHKSTFMVGFVLSEQERADLLAFFDSLTDEDFLTDPRFSNPWPP